MSHSIVIPFSADSGVKERALKSMKKHNEKSANKFKSLSHFITVAVESLIQKVDAGKTE